MKKALLITAVLAFSVVAYASEDYRDTLKQDHPEWASVLNQGRDLLRNGETIAAGERLRRAVEMARDLDVPLALAESLEAATRVVPFRESRRALEMLEQAYAVKERELGPNHVALVDTLFLLADQSTSVARLETPETAIEEVFYDDKLRHYARARDILATNYGPDSCETGKADVAVAVVYQALGKLDRAETTFRYVIANCGVDPEDHDWDLPGARAVQGLTALLEMSGRGDEAKSLPPLPEPPAISADELAEIRDELKRSVAKQKAKQGQ